MRAGAPVDWLVAALEHVCAEILELSGKAAQDNKTSRIVTTSHITHAVKKEEWRMKTSAGGVASPQLPQQVSFSNVHVVVLQNSPPNRPDHHLAKSAQVGTGNDLFFSQSSRTHREYSDF
jgi:hypothetical protein